MQPVMVFSFTLYDLETNYLSVCCCWMRLKCGFRHNFGPWQVKCLGQIFNLKLVALLYRPHSYFHFLGAYS